MIILGLDLARRTGFAIGAAGSMPKSGSWELRCVGQGDAHLEPPALARSLMLLVADARPDLIAVEEMMNPAAQRDSRAIVTQGLLHGGLDAWAGVSRIPVVRVAASTARKIVCGRASAGERDATKRMVRDRLVMLGLLPRGTADFDRSDAVCIFAWASAVHGRTAAPLVLA